MVDDEDTAVAVAGHTGVSSAHHSPRTHSTESSPWHEDEKKNSSALLPSDTASELDSEILLEIGMKLELESDPSLGRAYGMGAEMEIRIGTEELELELGQSRCSS